jgi:hypothetical protein
MNSWTIWYELVKQLRPAFSRAVTFQWFVVSLAGFCCRIDLMGVTSIIRSLGLKSSCYSRLLKFYHSDAVNLNTLTKLWAKVILKYHPNLITMNGRILLVADGIKKQKSGKKMPAVKLLHQESESNTKAEYILGHSCQAIGILAKTCKTVFCIPIVNRIHEGLVESNRDKRTLMDKLIKMVQEIELESPYYLVADAYYGNKKIMKGLLDENQHLICRARSNAVAFEEPIIHDESRRGRKKKYGAKVKLREIWDEKSDLIKEVESPVYGESGVKLKVITLDLTVKYCNSKVRFVLVDHPNRGRIILFSTDTSLDSLSIIKAYGYRFKIEVSFKQAIWTIGTFTYRFWMKEMKPTKRKKGDTYLHRESQKYRDSVKRKVNAYHLYIQTGVIAQGLLQMVATLSAECVWLNFGSWIRTVRPGLAPSEKVTSVSMRNSLPEFLASERSAGTFGKFILKNLDLSRAEGLLFAS